MKMRLNHVKVMMPDPLISPSHERLLEILLEVGVHLPTWHATVGALLAPDLEFGQHLGGLLLALLELRGHLRERGYP